MKMDFKKPLVCKGKHSSTSLNFVHIIDGKRSVHLDADCHSDSGYGGAYGKKDHVYHHFITVDNCGYSEKDVQRWFLFIASCGFPCKYLGKQLITETSGYNKLDEECYVIEVPCEKYSTAMHMLAGLTAIRTIQYRLTPFKEIPALTFKIKAALIGRIDNLRAFCLAHIFYIKDTYDSFYGHSLTGCLNEHHLVPLDGEKITGGVTKAEFLERVKAHGNSINKAMYKPSHLKKAEFFKIMKEEDYEQLINKERK